MRNITGAVFVSLDGVMQAPGTPDEDSTGGFRWGGWLPQFFDDAVGARVDQLFTPPFDLLLGRRTYDIFAAYWPFHTGEEKGLADRLNAAGKYVVSSREQRLEWQNSHRLADVGAVAELKQSDGPDLVIQGSGTLYPQLLAAGLVDRLILMTFPVVLGSGKRVFGEGTPAAALRMIEHEVTPGGNIIAAYEPHGAVARGSFGAQEPSAAELRRLKQVELGTW